MPSQIRLEKHQKFVLFASAEVVDGRRAWFYKIKENENDIDRTSSESARDCTETIGQLPMDLQFSHGS